MLASAQIHPCDERRERTGEQGEGGGGGRGGEEEEEGEEQEEKKEEEAKLSDEGAIVLARPDYSPRKYEAHAYTRVHEGMPSRNNA